MLCLVKKSHQNLTNISLYLRMLCTMFKILIIMSIFSLKSLYYNVFNLMFIKNVMHKKNIYLNHY